MRSSLLANLMLIIEYCCLYHALDLQDLSTSCKCIALNKISSIPDIPAPGNLLSTLCFHEFGSFRFHIDVISYSVCPSMADLPHLAKCPQGASMLSKMAGLPYF